MNSPGWEFYGSRVMDVTCVKSVRVSVASSADSTIPYLEAINFFSHSIPRNKLNSTSSRTERGLPKDN